MSRRLQAGQAQANKKARTGNGPQKKGAPMQTRRQFIKTVGVAGAATFVPWRGNLRRISAQALPGGTLDPATISKYVMPLVVPAAMPRTGKIVRRKAKPIEYYEIGVRPSAQQILPAGLPATTVWGY